MSVPALYVYPNLKYIKEQASKLEKVCDISKHYTRNCDNLVIPLYKKTKTFNSPERFALNMFNLLPHDVKGLPLKNFLHTIKKMLLENPINDKNEFADVLKKRM